MRFRQVWTHFTLILMNISEPVLCHLNNTVESVFFLLTHGLYRNEWMNECVSRFYTFLPLIHPFLWMFEEECEHKSPQDNCDQIKSNQA